MKNGSSEFSPDTTVFAALELSKASWLLAIHSPEREQPSLNPIKGGDTVTLFTRLNRAVEQRKKRGRRTPKIVICFEAGFELSRLYRRLIVVSQAAIFAGTSRLA